MDLYHYLNRILLRQPPRHVPVHPEIETARELWLRPLRTGFKQFPIPSPFTSLSTLLSRVDGIILSLSLLLKTLFSFLPAQRVRYR
jgi:hypothetical protein